VRKVRRHSQDKLGNGLAWYRGAKCWTCCKWLNAMFCASKCHAQSWQTLCRGGWFEQPYRCFVEFPVVNGDGIQCCEFHRIWMRDDYCLGLWATAMYTLQLWLRVVESNSLHASSPRAVMLGITYFIASCDRVLVVLQLCWWVESTTVRMRMCVSG